MNKVEGAVVVATVLKLGIDALTPNTSQADIPGSKSPNIQDPRPGIESSLANEYTSVLPSGQIDHVLNGLRLVDIPKTIARVTPYLSTTQTRQTDKIEAAGTTASMLEPSVTLEQLKANPDKKIQTSIAVANPDGITSEIIVVDKRGGPDNNFATGANFISISRLNNGKYSKFQEFIPVSVDEQIYYIAKAGDISVLTGYNTETHANIRRVYKEGKSWDLTSPYVRDLLKLVAIPDTSSILGGTVSKDLSAIIRMNEEKNEPEVIGTNIRWTTMGKTWEQSPSNPDYPYNFVAMPANPDTKQAEVFAISKGSGIDHYTVDVKTGETVAENIPLTDSTTPVKCSGLTAYKDAVGNMHFATAHPKERKIYDFNMATKEKKAIDYSSVPELLGPIYALQAVTINGKTSILYGGTTAVPIEGSIPPANLTQPVVGSIHPDSNTMDAYILRTGIKSYLNDQSMQLLQLPGNQPAVSYDFHGFGEVVIPVNSDGKLDTTNTVYLGLTEKPVVLSRRAFLPLLNK